MAGARILIVEDERIVAMDIENSVRRMGHTVVGIASTGEAAIAQTGELKPDLVLMDVRLKGEIDGIAAAESISARSDVPIVYLTAHSDDNTLNRAKTTGPFGYILKPFNDRDLNIAIEMALYRHEADRKLKESEERYRLVFETSRDAIFIVSASGKLTDCNEALTDLFLSTREGMIGKDVRELLVDREGAGKLTAAMSSKRFLRDYEVRLYNGEMKVMECLITCSALVGRDGQVDSYHGSIRDVTRQKRLEEQLLHSQKLEAIGTLASGVAHDFNNILTGIMGYGTMIETRLDHQDPLRQYAENIVLSCEKASDLTRSLLTFARKRSVEVKPVDAVSLVTGIRKLLARLVKESVAINTVLPDEPLRIMADGNQIEQVLMNLCTNASDAMPDGGTVTISAARTRLDEQFIQSHGCGVPGDHVLLTVSDTGTGMDKATQERAFEPFFTTKEAGKGTGLGLSLVYGIVKQHNGLINLHSEPGEGTVFRIHLPLIESAAMGRPKIEAEKPRGGRETILLAEDNGQVRMLVKLVLTDYGYKVIEAADGEEALRAFSDHGPAVDLLLLDVVMPKKDGAAVYETIRASRPDMKVVFMSGHTPDAIRERQITEGDVPILQKPIVLNELLRKLREILDSSAPV